MADPIPQEELDALSESLFQGRKIEAIKRYRELTGLQLKESKDAVEALEAALRAKSPEKFTARPKGGCLGAAAALCIAGTALAWCAVSP
jgi:hypothetical protein